jgi:hypothetical protein
MHAPLLSSSESTALFHFILMVCQTDNALTWAPGAEAQNGNGNGNGNGNALTSQPGIPSSVASVWGNENENLNSFQPQSEGIIYLQIKKIRLILIFATWNVTRHVFVVFFFKVALPTIRSLGWITMELQISSEICWG